MKQIISRTAMVLALIISQTACKKYLDIGVPRESLIHSEIFRNNDIATAAVTGIYQNMLNNNYASGGSNSITALCGLSADEFLCHHVSYTEFSENQLTPFNGNLSSSLYLAPYRHIYAANSILEGLSGSTGVTPDMKMQLEGEALFIRAFAYFNLTNLFGEVPLQLTSDYRITQLASKSSVAAIYGQIIADLVRAESCLPDNYISNERVRPNKGAVQALLARVYLYRKDWANAERYASLVIGKSNLYRLVGLNEVFLKNSSETIWQLMPNTATNTSEGLLFILVSAPTFATLNPSFINNAFEPNDRRRTSWIGSYAGHSFAFKYKVRSSATVTEYSMVMRLAEQYLIRAEARAHQNLLGLAAQDLDIIRARANLALIKDTNPSIEKTALLDAVMRERRCELFAEWGHRWFDLKRTGSASIQLGPTKPQWQPTDELYPIPQTEIDRNKNITQNAGY
ncbi:MAG: RagB/SusD family nutrient uptake outer membrane protein [Pedobacter sp.]|nr:MAG: RagB/SusD family nutrient uptake outer membrane protein [Pedobacter sp.]